MGKGYVDLKLVSDDAIYRDGEGTEYVVEWVTQQEIDLARQVGPSSSDAPGLTVTADQHRNRGIVCADVSAAAKG